MKGFKNVLSTLAVGLSFSPAFPSDPAYSAELPNSFLGTWVLNDGAGEFEITGIYIGPKTYHEPGYNCDIKTIAAKPEAGSINRGRVYILEMSCSGDGPNPRRQRVREQWALRRIAEKDVLVQAGAAGATYPSIHILERSSLPDPDRS